MVAHDLSDERRLAAQGFTKDLLEAGFPISLSCYHYDEADDDWEFVIETPMMLYDPLLGTYDRIERFARVLGTAELADQVTLVFPGSEAGDAIRRAMDVELGSTIDITHSQIENVYFPHVVVFYSNKSAVDREAAKSARRRFDKRLARLEAA